MLRVFVECVFWWFVFMLSIGLFLSCTQCGYLIQKKLDISDVNNAGDIDDYFNDYDTKALNDDCIV